MKIRKAKEEDLKDILRLCEYSSSPIKITKEMIDERMKKGRIIVAVENKRIVGFLQSKFYVDAITNQCVDKVFLLISPEHLGKGIGARLLETERKYAAKNEIDVLRIEKIDAL
jgi:N-acetylglutamate synthase-like GNAT family acetyltransferase